MRKTLNKIAYLTDKFSDTSGLFLTTVGGILAAVSVGTLPGGGTTNGYSFVYVTHPILLKIGMTAIVVGFIIQLTDNLSKVHKIKAPWIASVMNLAFVLLFAAVIFN